MAHLKNEQTLDCSLICKRDIMLKWFSGVIIKNALNFKFITTDVSVIQENEKTTVVFLREHQSCVIAFAFPGAF